MIERDLSLIKLSNQREYLETIVKQAAERAFRERRLRDAIRLFNIAEEYDRVIAVINIELGSSLFQPGSKPASSRIGEETNSAGPKGATVSLTASEDIVAVANNVLAHYDRTSTISSRITRKNRDTCALLLRFKTVLDLHEQGKNEQALTVSAHMSLILQYLCSLMVPTLIIFLLGGGNV
jgi:nuclear pore complex protein Nup93